jgi:DNA-directed RNA polymerase specialized sigma24 family protein
MAAAVDPAAVWPSTGSGTPQEAAGRDDLTTTRMASRAIRHAQDGDREALGFLYARYADNVCGYVRSIVHDTHEAEDITQHVFAELIHVIGKYEERDVPFLAWILGVSRNVAVDHIRRQRMIPVGDVRGTDESIGESTGCTTAGAGR